MFQVTEEAAVHAANQLAEEGAPKGTVIRVVAQHNGLILTTGSIEPADVIYEHDGCPVIAVPSALTEELGNVVLQAEEIAGGTRLQLRELG